MSWNIEKPGDRINGPLTITGNTTLTGTATISSDLTVDTSTLKVDAANNRVGVGTATPSVPLDVVGNAKISGDLVVDTNTLVVDSANNRLGIGTATPENKQHIQIAPSATQLDGLRVTDSSRVAIVGSTGSTYNYRGIGANEVAVYANAALNLVADGSVIKFTAGSGSESARIDSSGNLGLGVTPSAWAAGGNINLSNSAGIVSKGVYLNTGTNYYYDGAFKYVGTGRATLFNQGDGAFQWQNAANNTGPAGAALSFSPLMTLDASGRLGIGTASPAESLDVAGYVKSSSGLKIATQGILYGDSGNSLVIGADPGNSSASSNIQMWVDGGLKATLDASGNLGLGVTPASRFHTYLSDAGTNDFVRIATLQRATTGTAAVGFGQYLRFDLERSDGSNEISGFIGTKWSNATAGVTKGDLVFGGSDNGALTTTMTLDASGRLGIGTATPAATVEVKTSSSAGSAYISADSTGGSFRASGHIQFYTDNAVYDTIWFKANKGSQNMRLTNDGNLGLGVTPSAWSGFKALQIARGSLTSFGADTFLSHNWYWSGTADTYIANDYATRYYQSQGKHIWDTGGTSAGTAGGTISFATKMTLDASGNLGVGTTTPSGASGKVIEINGAAGQARLVLKNNTTGSGASDGSQIALVGSQLVIQNRENSEITFEANGDERLRINTSGQTLTNINGTASAPSFSRLTDENTGLYFPAADTLALAVGGSDAVYIDSSRRVSLGNTTVGAFGGTSPLFAIWSTGISKTDTDGGSQVIYSNSSFAADLGGATVYGFQYTTGGNYVTGARIRGAKENSTSGDFGGYLGFDTRPHGGNFTERLRIKSTGQLRFVPLASDPGSAEAGDVYYNSTTNKLRCYNGSAWNDLF